MRYVGNPPKASRLGRHPASQLCQEVHCFTHDVDEDPDRVYAVCPECRHAYRSGGELRRAYRIHWNRIFISGWSTRGIGVPGFASRKQLLAKWLRSRITPAGEIDFCQHCLHDF